jgi:phage shock protein PspC (stress-responsive transcriptional regulator)
MRRLFRDQWDKKIAGVCGGIGQYLQLDPTLIRMIFIAACCVSLFVPMIVIYLIAWLIMPEGPKTYVQVNSNKLWRSRNKRKIAGICGGLAAYFHVDPTLVRIVYIVTCCITGFIPMLLTYIIGIFLIPESRD